ncbi:MAG TPA: type III-B CRISPR module-associated protein Cmr5 [Candidatus Paceibacterota bacterium]|nr:type III-B CRISPR module-associated protein Cmr5 [Verrucomicrobiota bacterium]HRZ43566.1 type III-B CRISPR module-associated protein Cmr5 [Candidatus Paceibacterota bacterium]
MQNLEQIRAAAALPVAQHTTKADVNKIPAMIITNGLLAAIAFANERKNDGQEAKRPAMQAVFDGAARHLALVGIVPGAIDSDSLIRGLAGPNRPEATSVRLQRATTEVLAFIAYVKRFAACDQDAPAD